MRESKKFNKDPDGVYIMQNPRCHYYGEEDLTEKQKNAKYEPARTEPKIQNNDPCLCGSTKKYKKCCKNK